MEHDSKTSLASVSTRSETNVQPPGKLRLPCSGPLLCSYDTWPPLSHIPFYTMTRFQDGLWGVVDIPTEKAMAPHSSTLAWKIPWMEEPGGLQSMGSLRLRHNWVTSLSLFTFMHWRRKWQPTPVFLPGESQRQGSLVGCRLWGHTESDTTEVT